MLKSTGDRWGVLFGCFPPSFGIIVGFKVSRMFSESTVIYYVLRKLVSTTVDMLMVQKSGLPVEVDSLSHCLQGSLHPK